MSNPPLICVSGVDRNQRVVDCTDRDAGDPIRLQLSFRQHGIDIGLVGTECAAALPQRDTFEGWALWRAMSPCGGSAHSGRAKPLHDGFVSGVCVGHRVRTSCNRVHCRSSMVSYEQGWDVSWNCRCGAEAGLIRNHATYSAGRNTKVSSVATMRPPMTA
jgi:hypothetical protein